ncbi:MAG: hypothetical protein QOG62_153 [Thermoleophilaceae bacterium]|jgi:hypothetical protein|nr:hypothetical protein [Thermoleophilaceae bacterium]
MGDEQQRKPSSGTGLTDSGEGDSGQQVEETSGDEQSGDHETSLGDALTPSDDPEEVDRLIEDAVDPHTG